MEWVASLIGAVLKWLVEWTVNLVVELVIGAIGWTLARTWFLLWWAWHQVFGRPTGGDLP